MGQEGPSQTPNRQEEIDAKVAKLQEAAEVRGKVTAAENLTPEQRETYLSQIEELESGLKAELSALNESTARVEQLTEEEIPEEKQQTLYDKFDEAANKAYEKTKRLEELSGCIDKAAFYGFLGIGAASMGVIDVGSFFTSDPNSVVSNIAVDTMMGAYVVPALWAVARSVTAIRAKLSEWKSDRLSKKAWNAKEKEA